MNLDEVHAHRQLWGGNGMSKLPKKRELAEIDAWAASTKKEIEEVQGNYIEVLREAFAEIKIYEQPYISDELRLSISLFKNTCRLHLVWCGRPLIRQIFGFVSFDPEQVATHIVNLVAYCMRLGNAMANRPTIQLVPMAIGENDLKTSLGWTKWREGNRWVCVLYITHVRKTDRWVSYFYFDDDGWIAKSTEDALHAYRTLGRGHSTQGSLQQLMRDTVARDSATLYEKAVKKPTNAIQIPERSKLKLIVTQQFSVGHSKYWYILSDSPMELFPRDLALDEVLRDPEHGDVLVGCYHGRERFPRSAYAVDVSDDDVLTLSSTKFRSVDMHGMSIDNPIIQKTVQEIDPDDNQFLYRKAKKALKEFFVKRWSAGREDVSNDR